MSDLNFCPALGFETKNHHLSSDFCGKAYSYYSKAHPDKERHFFHFFHPDNWQGRNVGRIISYIPVISTIRVVVGCIKEWKNGRSAIPKELFSNCLALRVRTIFIGLSLGVLLIIPDIIATIWRNCCDKAPQPVRTY